MLALLGVFFKIRAPALAEDLPINEEEWAKNNYTYNYIVELYDQNAVNCWIAAGIYVVTFVLSVVMFKVNQRSSYVES
jgi:ribonuclease kappa